MKNTLEGITDELIQKNVYLIWTTEIVQPEQQKEKYILKNENGSMKQHKANQCGHDRCPRRRRDKQVENVFDESLAEKLTNLKKEDSQSTEFQTRWIQTDPCQDILNKMAKVKERILKPTRENQRII